MNNIKITPLALMVSLAIYGTSQPVMASFEVNYGDETNEFVVGVNEIQNVNDGGIANSTIVYSDPISGGVQNVNIGGVANDTVLAPSSLEDPMQPRVGSSQNIYKGGVAYGTQINDYSFGVQNVEGEGVSNQTHIGLTGTQNHHD